MCSTVFLSACRKKIYIKKHNNSDMRVLLHEPKVQESEYEYVILDDFDDNKTAKSSSIDFISRIDKTRKSPYNKIVNSENKNGHTDYLHTYNDSQVMLLARLIASEAEDQSYLGKIAVGSVVMNRCRVNNDTVSETIYAQGQFDGVSTKLFKDSPSAEDINAAREVLSGKNVVPQAYYYANLKLCDPSFAKEDKFTLRIGDHWFFRK